MANGLGDVHLLVDKELPVRRRCGPHEIGAKHSEKEERLDQGAHGRGQGGVRVDEEAEDSGGEEDEDLEELRSSRRGARTSRR